jgi:hypothetical protein
MSIELQTPVVDPHREDEENSDERQKNIEQEMPSLLRHHDIIFGLGYICQECDLLLVMK